MTTSQRLTDTHTHPFEFISFFYLFRVSVYFLVTFYARTLCDRNIHILDEFQERHCETELYERKATNF